MTIFYAQTMPGVEEIAWLEIRDRLQGSHFVSKHFAKDQNGIVVFRYDGNPNDVLKLRSAEDVYWQALYVEKMARQKRVLGEIHDMVATGEAVGRAVNQYLRYRKFSKPPTYRVISRLYGKYPYRRKEFELAVLKGLNKRYPRWMPVTDDAEIEIWANLLGSTLLIGLRISDRTMRHRYEKEELPASLRPSVAGAMVYLTDPQPNDVFFDPMCGSGTILLERKAFGKYRRLLGGDVDESRVGVARRNVKGRNVTIDTWDATDLPLNTYAVDKVAVNLPFGKQIGDPDSLPALYNQTFAQLARVVKPNGRLVVLSSEYDLVKEAIRLQPKLTLQTGYSIAVLGQWGRIYIIDREM